MDMFIITYSLVVVPTLWFALSAIWKNQRKLSHIPTVGGSSLPLLSYYGSFKFVLHAADILQEGYDKYKGGLFKHAQFRGWFIVVSSPQLVEEVRKAPEDQLSFDESIREVLEIDYTLGANIHHNGYHIPVIRSQLTRGLDGFLPAMRDEMIASFHDEIPMDTHKWSSVCVLPAITQIVCRTSNRVFVGLPTCRDPDYCALNKKFTVDIIKGAAIINLFPTSLKPLAARFLTNLADSVNRGIKHLEPVILERFRKIQECGEDGEWRDRPIDFLQWLIDAAEGEERTVRALVVRIMIVNVAAIHTSSMALTHALFYLAAHPQYIQPLREEVEAVVLQEGGWSKVALGKMRKVDSFLKEVERMTGLGATSLMRKAVSDFRFSDGTLIPAGTNVIAASRAIHFDDTIYPDAKEFKPWRFSDTREDGESMKRQMVTTSPEYLLFGHGKHACPGRFFATHELKVLFAHVVTTYDVKVEKEGVLPPSKWFATSLVPDMKAEILFRKRQT